MSVQKFFLKAFKMGDAIIEIADSECRDNINQINDNIGLLRHDVDNINVDIVEIKEMIGSVTTLVDDINGIVV